MEKKKKNKQKDKPKTRQSKCSNCDGTGKVTYKKLNPATKKHEAVTIECVVCDGKGN